MGEPVSLETLRAGLPMLHLSPVDNGHLTLIVARPQEDERKVVETAVLTRAAGLEGDTWQERHSRHSPDGLADPNRQITLVSSRAMHLICPDQTRWPMAGDQLYVDMDLSPENLAPGQRLKVGTAVLEITAAEHRGCRKYAQRFGHDALKFVNQDGWPLRLRGIYARVVQDGAVTAGDTIEKIANHDSFTLSGP
jgi:MOSC domain-containing protein YiiM